MYTNIDQTLVKSLHRLLNCEIGELDCHVITKENIKHASIVYTCYTYFVMHWTMQFISIWSMFSYNTQDNIQTSFFLMTSLTLTLPAKKVYEDSLLGSLSWGSSSGGRCSASLPFLRRSSSYKLRYLSAKSWARDNSCEISFNFVSAGKTEETVLGYLYTMFSC